MSGQVRAIAFAAAIMAVAVPGFAQEDGAPAQPPQADEAPAEGEGGRRYVMKPMDGGVIRLDRETGAMAFCTVRDGRMACRLAADERESYEAEIADLQARIDAFEASREAEKKVIPPEDPRLREAMRQAGRALRRFFDAVGELREDLEENQERE